MKKLQQNNQDLDADIGTLEAQNKDTANDIQKLTKELKEITTKTTAN